MKKNIILLIAVVIIGIGYMFYRNIANDIITVKLNEEIILRKNEKIKLEDKEVYLIIKKFINSPPPEEASAIWSGLAVIYKVEIDGKIYTTNDIGFLEEENIPYSINILDSDYETFAKVKIIKNEDVEIIQE